ncbi:MAG: 16S rRNA (cytosine(967)-C(5))-methyltransferase RsmB [Gammaproteobacteria bacterium]|nr:16S rRNA (cytosine(967)-C(5))-methyltransferase RsmB [Gammaproteobacteria bacterium]
MSAQCRAVAARVLAATLAEGQSLSQNLPPALDQVKPKDRALLQQLCYGTLRSYHRMQGVMQQLLEKPLKSKDADIQSLLLCGAYQLLEMRTPDHAALSSSVDACRLLKKNWATGLVNGVLRRCARERDKLLQALGDAQAASHPDWLYQLIRQHWPQQCEQIFLANNQPPPMTLRINQRRVETRSYIAELAEQGIEAAPGGMVDGAVRLSRPVDVEQLPGFAQGRVSVQDEAAQLAAGLLAPEPGDRVLDACSAPGGKSCHLLELQPAISQLVAMDRESTRLQRVAENMKRLGLEANLLQGDACAPATVLDDALFDRILVDAPCSGTGVIRRHPDIKLLRRASDIASLAATQLELLQALWPLLKPGGILLYVTCSILPEENAEVLRAFLEQSADAVCETLEETWGLDCSPGRQVLPNQDGADGLYFARLLKQA